VVAKGSGRKAVSSRLQEMVSDSGRDAQLVIDITRAIWHCRDFTYAFFVGCIDQPKLIKTMLDEV